MGFMAYLLLQDAYLQGFFADSCHPGEILSVITDLPLALGLWSCLSGLSLIVLTENK
jgi:hypothetical protein